MSNHRKARGMRTERVVAAYLAQWWHGATVGRGMGKDIVNIPMDIEVKSRSDFSPLAWLRQSKKRGSISGEASFVVVRMNGQGDSSPEEYLAFTDLKTLTELWLKAGYANLQRDSIQLVPIDCPQCGNLIIEGMTCRICEKLNNANL